MSFVITFGPNEGYYFCNGAQDKWKHIPNQLYKLLDAKDPRFQPENVAHVALGPRDAYFIRSTGGGFAYGNLSQSLQTRIDDLGGAKAVASIQFTPDPDVFLIFTKSGQLVGNGLTQSFYNAILRHSLTGFRDVSLVGTTGYTLTTHEGRGVHLNVTQNYKDNWQRGGSVARTYTSCYNPAHYFIEFKDGKTCFCCPKDWHDDWNELRRC